jgi:hypothetical protein
MNNISNFNQIFTNLYQAIRNINIELDNVKTDVLNVKNLAQNKDQKVLDELIKSVGNITNDVKELRESIGALNLDSLKGDILQEIDARLQKDTILLGNRLDTLENRCYIGKDEVQQMIDMSINVLLSSLSCVPSVDAPQNELSVTPSEITVDVSNIIQASETVQPIDNVEEETLPTSNAPTSTKKRPAKGKSRSKKTDVN